MNRKTEVKVKFFDFLIMLQLSFAFRLPECSRPIIAAFPCILFCVVVFLIVESFLFCVQPWCCGMCQATVLRRFVSISVIVSRLSMDSIAPSAFFHLSSGRIRLAPALFAGEAKNHDRATKSSPFPGRKDNTRTTGAAKKCFCRPFYIDEREFANYSMLPELSFRRLPQQRAG